MLVVCKRYLRPDFSKYSMVFEMCNGIVFCAFLLPPAARFPSRQGVFSTLLTLPYLTVLSIIYSTLLYYKIEDASGETP